MQKAVKSMVGGRVRGPPGRRKQTVWESERRQAKGTGSTTASRGLVASVAGDVRQEMAKPCQAQEDIGLYFKLDEGLGES